MYSRRLPRSTKRGQRDRVVPSARRSWILRLWPVVLIGLVLPLCFLGFASRSASAASFGPASTANVVAAPGFYSLLADPNILFLLFIVAMSGIYVEISHPGLIAPGVAGSIALLLFLFGANSLSPNWAGLVLMALAFALLILDVRLPTHGALTVGAVISLIMGSLLFFNSSGGPSQEAQVNPLLIYGMSGLVGCLGFYVVAMVVRTRRARVDNGREGMIGTTVIALTPLLPEGRVSYGGENWAAVLEPPARTVDAGSELRIVAVEGLLLHVQLATHTLPPADRKYIEGAYKEDFHGL